MGDVLALYGGSGALLVTYEYDAWGNLVYMNDTTALGSGTANPIRYRGYYYDSDTGLYYCQSRYYDPQVGRFISPEPNVYSGKFDEGAGLIGYNVYAYCANNSIIHKDATGEIISMAACLIIGGIVGAIAGGAIGATISYKKFKTVKWNYVLIGALAGGALGVAAGYGIGIYIGASSTTALTASSFAKSFKVSTKIANQMSKRGWTKELIKQTIKKNVGRKAFNRATGNAATAYFTSSGAYVVIDNITKQIVQVSDRFDPNWAVERTVQLMRNDVFIK